MPDNKFAPLSPKKTFFLKFNNKKKITESNINIKIKLKLIRNKINDITIKVYIPAFRSIPSNILKALENIKKENNLKKILNDPK